MISIFMRLKYSFIARGALLKGFGADHLAVEVDVFQTAEAKMNLLVHDSFWGKQVILASDCF